MPSNITVYDLLISCPSDVSRYVALMEEEVNRFNNTFGRAQNIIIRTRHWSKDIFSESGDKAQELINRQIVDESDMVLSVFWTRFGTPTENYGSGTEEEVERMLSVKKQVFMYFLNKPISPMEIMREQYQQVQLFMEKYKDKGIYFIVPDEKALASKFRENLELYLTSIIHGANFKKTSKKKEILWVDDRPENNVYERNILEEEYGLSFSLALSTKKALEYMEHKEFALVISDMGRKEGRTEGYVLLEEVRKRNKNIPFIIYAGSKKPEHVKEIFRRGGQGCTNHPVELVDLVIKNLLNS